MAVRGRNLRWLRRGRAAGAGRWIGAAVALMLAACSSNPSSQTGSANNAAAPDSSANAAASVAAPSGSKLAEAVRTNRTIHIGVFGDSFADGIWWALDKEFHGNQQFAVHKFGKPSTGFVNYTDVDLLADARTKIDSQPIDVAIIAFGANDTQPLHGAEHPTPFLSDEWKRVVGGRIEAMVQLFRDRGAAVMFVGLPKMRSADYDARVTRLNEYYASEMRRLGVPYVETVSITSDARGNYVPNLAGADGQSRPARNADGIHMSMSGYEVLVRPVTERLRAAIDEARRSGAQPAG
jgi:uncharacterized protein